MTKRKLGLLLLSVAVVAVLLSGCFLFPKSEDTTPPQLSVTPNNLTVPSGGNVHFLASASDNSGIQKIVAEFDGTSTTVYDSNSAVFDFTAPTVNSQTTIFATVTAFDKSKNHNEASALVSVTVLPPEGTNVTYGVELNNSNNIYMYPVGPQENGSVIFSVHIFSGESLVNGVNVFVDGQQVSSTPTVSTLKSSVQSTTTKKEYTFFYPITADHAGPHTYYVKIYGSNNQVLETSSNRYFYIVYPGAQSVELSDATPVHNASYVTRNISFTATATDYTSNYEVFLVNKTPFGSPLVNYRAATSIITTLGATKIVNKVYNFDINTASMTDGPYTFEFRDESVGGGVATDSHTYIVDNTLPVLTASYKSIPSSGTTLYVGADPTTFDVYAYDVNWMSSAATLGTTSFSLTKNGTKTVVVTLPNNATETFTAWVKDFVDNKTSLNLTIVRDTVPPQVNWAKITGLASPNGVPYSGDATITVEASVTDTNLKSVAFVLDGPNYAFPMTKDASTGLWEATVDLTGVLPGTYHASIIATDLALNEATFDTVPATVNVYRTLASVFTTSLESTPSTPVNGFVKSATITVNINPDWIYAVKKIYLMKGTATADTLPGTPGSATYYFTLFSGTGTYHVVVEDITNATVTNNVDYTIKIDNTLPSSLEIVPAATIVKTPSQTFNVSATDTQSGVKTLTLQFETLNATGQPGGPWVTIASTSGTSSAKFTWDNINTLPDGWYYLRLIATDGVGNVSTTAAYQHYIVNDNAGTPVVKVDFPPTWTNSTSTVRYIKLTVNNESDVTFGATSGDNSLIDFGTPTISNPYYSYIFNDIPFKHSWSATFTGANGTSLVRVQLQDVAEFGFGGTEQVATKVIGFDNLKPTAAPTAPATVAGAATFTVTVHATDNLSAIKSVTIGGVSATLTTKTSTNEFGVLNGIYVATVTAPNPTTSRLATYDIAVLDNAGNEATTSVSVYVDVTAPTITVKLVNAHGPQAISNGASETNYTSTPASFTWLITTDSGTAASVAGTVTGPSEISTLIVSTSGTVTISASGQYVITITATNPVNNKVETFIATKTVVIDNATPTVSVTAPGTVQAASSTAYVTYEATDNGAAGLINNEALLTLSWTGGSTSMYVPAATNATVDVFNMIKGLDNKTVTITLTATDQALNATSTFDAFYVDTVDPTITNVYKTLSGSGTMYIQVSDPIATTTSFKATDIYFVQGGLTFSATNVGTDLTFDKPDGLIIIKEFVDQDGNVVYPQDIGGMWKVYVSDVTDLAGNPIDNSGSSWDIHQPTAPNPVNP